MEHAEARTGPTATGRPPGELIEAPSASYYRERWGDVLDALELMSQHGWRMVAGPNWTIEFGEGDELNISVRPLQPEDPS